MLLVTDYFSVARRETTDKASLPGGKCSALMILSAPENGATIHHAGSCETEVSVVAGDTVLITASLDGPVISAGGRCQWLEITLPEENK